MSLKSYSTIGRNVAVLLLAGSLSTNRLAAQNAPSRVLGQPDLTNTSAGAVSSATTNYPWDVATDGQGNLYVSDNWHRILIWKNVASKATGAAADFVLGQPDFTSSGSGNGPARLSLPVALMLDASGNLYVSDYSNNRVLIYRGLRDKVMNNTLVDGAPADFVIGQNNLTENYGGSPPTARNFNQVAGLAMDSQGNLYVADYYIGRVLMFPGVRADVDNGTFVNGMAATKVFGRPDLTTGDWTARPADPSSLAFPQGLAVDAADNLYVVDKGHHRVLRYDNVPAKSSSALPDAVLGQPDFVSSASGYGTTSFANPYDITFNAGGELLVAEEIGHCISRFANPGALGSGAAVSSRYALPSKVFGVASVAGSGTWITEPLNHRVALLGGASALPIGLLSFDAVRHEGSVLLHWSLPPSEAKPRNVRLQRSADGGQFETLASFATGSALQYQHRDAAPLAGQSFYRLELTAADGAVSYSETRQLAAAGASGLPQAWPNPAAGLLNVHTGSQAPCEVWLTDMAGQTVLSPRRMTEAGTLDLSPLPAGNYLLHIGTQACLKVVK